MPINITQKYWNHPVITFSYPVKIIWGFEDIVKTQKIVLLIGNITASTPMDFILEDSKLNLTIDMRYSSRCWHHNKTINRVLQRK